MKTIKPTFLNSNFTLKFETETQVGTTSTIKKFIAEDGLEVTSETLASCDFSFEIGTRTGGLVYLKWSENGKKRFMFASEIQTKNSRYALGA
jgi:hypothetical protein